MFKIHIVLQCFEIMQYILKKNTCISFEKCTIVHENPFVSILGRKKRLQIYLTVVWILNNKVTCSTIVENFLKGWEEDTFKIVSSVIFTCTLAYIVNYEILK